MPRFPAYLRRQHHHTDEANIRRATRDNQHLDHPPTYATAGGDNRKLRGIPAIGRGVTGAINGTSPHHR